MLADKAAMATIAVRDIDAAKNFYGEVLGLKKRGKWAATLWSTRSVRNSTMVIYAKSEFAGNQQGDNCDLGALAMSSSPSSRA